MTVGSIPGMGSIPNLPGPVLSYDRGKHPSLSGPIRERADIRIQPPGVDRCRSLSDPRGSFGIDTHGHRSDFCESVVFTIVL